MVTAYLVVLDLGLGGGGGGVSKLKDQKLGFSLTVFLAISVAFCLEVMSFFAYHSFPISATRRIFRVLTMRRKGTADYSGKGDV